MQTQTAPWSAPTITVEPVKSWFDPDYHFNAWGERESPEQRKLDGWVARFELDTHTGTLSVHANGCGPRYRLPENSGDHYVAERDMWSGHHYYDRCPRILATWCKFEITEEYAQDLLNILAPVAQRLVNALEPLPDGGWDWTREAVLTYNEFRNYGEHPYEGRTTEQLMAEIDKARGYAGYVSFEKILEVVPEAVNPAWTLMSDAELDEVAHAWSHRYLINDTSPRKLLDKYHDAVDCCPYGHTPTPVNVRAGLRRTRAKLVQDQTGYPAASADAWFRLYVNEVPDVTPDLDDTQLAELAELTVARIAHKHHETLVGMLEWLRNERARMRDLVRTEAVEMGRRTNELVAAARQAQTARAAMAARIAGWGDPKETAEDGEVNAAEIGRLVGMSRQGVAKLLARMLAEDVEDDSDES